MQSFVDSDSYTIEQRLVWKETSTKGILTCVERIGDGEEEEEGSLGSCVYCHLNAPRIYMAEWHVLAGRQGWCALLHLHKNNKI